MALNKKGLFFTFISMNIITLMLLSLTGSHTISNYNEEVVQARFDVLQNHNKNLKSYAKNVLHVQSKKAFRDLRNYTRNYGVIDDVSKRFRELVMNATLYNQEIYAPSMDQRGFNNWTNRMDRKGQDFLNVESNLSMVNPRPVQKNPWMVIIYADVIINTSKQNMSYNGKDTISTNLSIVGWADPLYYHNGFSNDVNVTGVFEFNQSTTLDMLKAGTYRHTTFAPSYLGRMENTTSGSGCCGIESLINANTLGITSAGQYNRSYVDYLFWGQNRSCDVGSHPLFNFTTISRDAEGLGFKLDSVYMSIYGMNRTDTDDKVCTP